MGQELFFDERLIVPDQSLKVYDGALAPWRKGKSPYFLQTIEAIAAHYDFNQQTKWKELPDNVKSVFLYGSGKDEISFRYDEGGRVYQVLRTFEGVIPNMERRYRETDSNWIREEFERYQNNRPCGTCNGYRYVLRLWQLKLLAFMRVKLFKCLFVRLSIGGSTVPKYLTQQKIEISRAILKEISRASRVFK